MLKLGCKLKVKLFKTIHKHALSPPPVQPRGSWGAQWTSRRRAAGGRRTLRWTWILIERTPCVCVCWCVRACVCVNGQSQPFSLLELCSGSWVLRLGDERPHIQRIALLPLPVPVPAPVIHPSIHSHSLLATARCTQRGANFFDYNMCSAPADVDFYAVFRFWVILCAPSSSSSPSSGWSWSL